MKLIFNLILCLMLLPVLVAVTNAEDQLSQPDAAQKADNLRLQLLDVQSREAELQGRIRLLEEAIKPENISRSMAGVGSTKPEELREFRRRQLSIELEGARNELKILNSSRERLETAIRTADSNAYHQSAEGPVLAAAQVLKADPTVANRWYLLAAIPVGIVALILIVAVLRKTTATS